MPIEHVSASRHLLLLVRLLRATMSDCLCDYGHVVASCDWSWDCVPALSPESETPVVCGIAFSCREP